MPSFLTSFALTVLLTPGVIALARRWGWLARPREDRWHSKPTPLLGGVALFGGTVGSWLIHGHGAALTPIIGAAFGVFLLGLVDDRLLIPPHIKLIGQVGAGALLILFGIRFYGLPAVAFFPLTVLWIVGITNAVNLLDNMDGLAAGVAGISAVTLAVYCAGGGAPATADAALALAGSCAAFLLFNFQPARIFMGDCGSMFLGFSLAALALEGIPRSAPNVMLSLLVPVGVLAIPIFDTTLVTLARLIHGRSVSQGGRDHSSHRLVALGLSERATVLVLYALTAVFGGVSVAASQVSLPVTLMLSAILFMGMLMLGLYLGFLRVYTEETRLPERVRLLRWNLMYKRQLAQVLLDLPLIPVAFVAAHLMRFEGVLHVEIRQGVLGALPLVLVAKLLGLAAARAYRGEWRYAGVADAMAAAAGSTLGSLLAVFFLAMVTGLRDVSRAALLIDWLLFTSLAILARTWYGAFRHLFGLLPPRDGPRVVILGVGPEAFALVGKLRDPISPRRAAVVGFLDDDPARRGSTLNGIPVLGSLADLPRVLEARRIQFCLLGVSPYSEAGRQIVELCRADGIPVYCDLDAPPAWGSEPQTA